MNVKLQFKESTYVMSANVENELYFHWTISSNNLLYNKKLVIYAMNGKQKHHNDNMSIFPQSENMQTLGLYFGIFLQEPRTTGNHTLATPFGRENPATTNESNI